MLDEVRVYRLRSWFCCYLLVFDYRLACTRAHRKVFFVCETPIRSTNFMSMETFCVIIIGFLIDSLRFWQSETFEIQIGVRID